MYTGLNQKGNFVVDVQQGKVDSFVKMAKS